MRRRLQSALRRAQRAETVVVAMGENPKAVSRWQVVASTVLLIGIAAMLANLAGLWDLPGQSRCAKSEPRRAQNRKIGRTRSGGTGKKAGSSRRSRRSCEGSSTRICAACSADSCRCGCCGRIRRSLQKRLLRFNWLTSLGRAIAAHAASTGPLKFRERCRRSKSPRSAAP